MSNYVQHKRILLGISGGIAAYKILELIRLLKEQQAEVKVILTTSGAEFVTPLSLQVLCGAPIYQDLFAKETESAMSHIDLARWAEVLLIAPATANFIAKYNHGIADDLLSTVCLATTAPVLIAPAMNQQMWLNAVTQDNIKTLQYRGIKILGPACGNQACGENGPGRMLEAAQLYDFLNCHFAPKTLSGKHIVITAGATQEALDPVRYLSNHSSGKMGYALANAALQLGATVSLISGSTHLNPIAHANLKLISVVSASQMYTSVQDILEKSKVDIFIGCAAVADYTPVAVNPQKIKKNDATLILELERTPDILKMVASLPASIRPLTIGFAAETENLLENAQQKLQTKCLDFIIANAVSNGKVFNQDTNQVIILNKNAEPKVLPEMRKDILAFKLFEEISL